MSHNSLLIISFFLSIVCIIIFTSKLKVNAFYVLIIAGISVGITAGLPAEQVINTLKEGFGNTLTSIGLVIVFGTTLGVMLEKTGAAFSMAEFILRKVGNKNAPLAMTITGYIFGIPIFCDSGFVVLSSLNKSVAAKTNRSMTIMGSLLGISLYSVHCLIPPHPGATASAGIIGVSLGKLMLIGLAIALIALAITFFWILFIEKKIVEQHENKITETQNSQYLHLPNLLLSFLPVLLPIILIATKSILIMYDTASNNLVTSLIFFIGDPAIALLIALIISMFINLNSRSVVIQSVIDEAIKNAGVILLITAAGGAFGSILKVTGIGAVIGEYLSYSGLGIFIPFLIAAGLKTAQGSSTVAIITASSIILPMISELQLSGEIGLILVVLSMGAGSMIFSHTNDSYFWVVTKFSNIEVNKSLKVFSSSTFVLGITTQLLVYVLSLFFV